MKHAGAVSISAGDHRERVLAERDALVEQHLDMVAPIARRVHRRVPPSFELDDLIGEGYIGLMHAAVRYRPEKHNGTPFSAYARRRIHGAIVDSVRRRAWTENTAFPLDEAPEPAVMPELPYLIKYHAPDPAPRRRRARSATAFVGLPEPLARALRRLPARQRAILAAFYGSSAKIGEVAGLLGLTVAQVATEHGAALDTLHAAVVRNVSISGSSVI